MSTNDKLYSSAADVDPLEDEEEASQQQGTHNFAKVGSARGTTLLYTYGPGAIMDLPHFTVMPMGLGAWDKVWERSNSGIPSIHAPRLLENVQIMLGGQVRSLRPFPRSAEPTNGNPRAGSSLGVPVRVFPRWLRCTGCGRLAPVEYFINGKDGAYRNTNPYRPDQAEFTHSCRGRLGTAKKAPHLCVPARYLLVCPNGHVDEFPYDWWVHQGGKCPDAPDRPSLYMHEDVGGGSVIECKSCKARRTMGEAQGTEARAKLPRCRARLPHLNTYDEKGCKQQTRLMLIGASNLWFPVTQSIIDMPRWDKAEKERDLYEALKGVLKDTSWMLEEDDLDSYLPVIRKTLEKYDGPASTEIRELRSMAEGGVELQTLIFNMHEQAKQRERDFQKRRENWDPTDLLVPEWEYLQHDELFRDKHRDEASGLVIHREEVAGPAGKAGISRILGVDRLRKVNALLGFTRIDAFDRVNDIGDRLVSLTEHKPEWVPATEDIGEGVFVQLDEDKVTQWEQRVLASDLWKALRDAHRRNFINRFSETAKEVNPDDRLPQPRYWLVHTLAHALIKTMAMSSGYGIPSLTERLYAWPATEDRPAAAGLLIATTASDSDGTLGGLVSLGETGRFGQIFADTLRGIRRCSSDPVCAQRVPKDPEDFLHGAACHCCCMLSETSCERANRFLDRRFLVPLPGEYADLAFFKD